MKKAIKIIVVLLAVAFLALTIGYQVVLRLYPTKHTRIIEEYAEEYSVDKALIYAVIKCESDFDKDAVSTIGAMGLMQMTPDTFEWVQKKLDGEVLYDSDKLYDPEISIKYGTYLLKLHLDEFGSIELALAAYHAGRGKVNEWLSDSSVSPNGETIEYIPYDDTRYHVEKVTKTIDIYNYLYFK